MSRNRLLAGLLIGSWTLNAALAVALYLKSAYPAGGYWGNAPRFGHGGGPMVRMPNLPLPPHIGDRFAEEFLAMREWREGLMSQLAEALAQSEIDSARVERIASALDSIHGVIHRRQIRFMTELGSSLPPPERRELMSRIMRRMGRHGP